MKLTDALDINGRNVDHENKGRFIVLVNGFLREKRYNDINIHLFLKKKNFVYNFRIVYSIKAVINSPTSLTMIVFDLIIIFNIEDNTHINVQLIEKKRCVVH